MQARIDRRALRTRSLLHAGLARLVQGKAYEAITVAQICAEAGVGRSTFYAHFTGKDDLKLYALDHLGAALTNAARANTTQEARGDESLPFAFCEAFFEHAVSHLPQLCAHAADPRGAASLARVRKMVAAQVEAELARTDDVAKGDPVLRGARVAYATAALMGLFEWWLDDGATRPPKEMAALFRRLANHGVQEA